jgi:phospholipase C
VEHARRFREISSPVTTRQQFVHLISIVRRGQFINAPRSSSLYQNAFGVSTLFGGGTASDPTMAFEEDCANGTLPAVSWLFPTSVASEHPSYLPAAGAQFVASKIEALTANQDLWNSTVLILNYDENDGTSTMCRPSHPHPEQWMSS